MPNSHPRVILGVVAAGVVISGSTVAATWGDSHSAAATTPRRVQSAPAPASTPALTPAPTPTPVAKAPATRAPATKKAPAKKTTTKSGAAAAKSVTYVVKPGDNLSVIAAWFHLHDYGVLYDWNRSVLGSNPNLIFPGQRITVSDGKMTLSSD